MRDLHEKIIETLKPDEPDLLDNWIVFYWANNAWELPDRTLPFYCEYDEAKKIAETCRMDGYHVRLVHIAETTDA